MNIGIILPNLELNQLAYEALTSINKSIVNNSSDNFYVFFENISNHCVKPKCAIMNISEIWNFNGLLISTTLKNTKMLLKVVAPIQKVFYIWDLEFLRQSKDYIDNLSIYRNSELEIVVRSNYSAKIFENYTNRKPSSIIQNLDFGEIKNVVRPKISA